MNKILKWIVRHILPKAIWVAIPYLVIYNPLIYYAYQSEIISGSILLVILLFILDFYLFYRKRITDFKSHFDHYKPVKKLRPEDIGIQKYPSYIERESDDQVLEMLRSRNIAFITGIPGMGKSRATYEAAKTMNGYYALIPEKGRRIELNKIKEPLLFSRKRVLLVIDDLDKHAGNIDLDSLISRLRRKCKELKVIVNCRSGHEYEQAAIKEKQFEYLLTDCDKNKTEPRKLTDQEENRLIKETGENAEDVQRDGTPGAIVNKLKGMKSRYNELENEPRWILHILKLLRESNIFSWDEKLIRNIGKSDLFSMQDNNSLWNQWLNILKTQGFIVRSDGEVEISHDTYLSEYFIEDYEVTANKILQLKDIFVKSNDEINLFYLANGFYYKGDIETAIGILKKVININSKMAEAHYNLGVLQNQLERNDEAEHSYKEAIRCDPNKVEAHYNLGVLLNQLERHDEAEQSYKEAIRCDPNKAEAHYNLGVLQNQLERYDEAEHSYKEAIRCDPNDASAHYNLGVLLDDLERYDEAEHSYKEAIRFDPNKAEAHYNLGVLLDDLERYDEAEHSYKEAIRCDPNKAEVHSNLGVLLYQLERYDEAEHSYKEAIRFDPNKAEAHYNLGVLLDDLERYDEAEHSYKEAIRCDPNDAEAHSNLGVLLDDLERYDEAEHSYKEAIRCDPNKAEAHANLGILYTNLKNIRAAKDKLLEARQLFANQGRNEDVEKINDILNNLDNLE